MTPGNCKWALVKFTKAPVNEYNLLVCALMCKLWLKVLFFSLIFALGVPKSAFAGYSLGLQDVPVSLGAAALVLWGDYRYNNMDVPKKDNVKLQSELLPWDRPIAGRYSAKADSWSDYFSVLGVLPVALSGTVWYKDDNGWKNFLTYMAMYVEALALQDGINKIARSLELWPRPYIYAEDGDGAKKAKEARGEAYGSFFSGHASAAFTVAVFTSEYFGEVYPNSPYKGVVRASVFSLASVVSVLRIAAGKHYPTDVVAGALVGTGVSLGILQMHKKDENNVTLWVSPNTLMLNILF